MSKLRLLLVDDQAMFREGLRLVLSQQADFEVVGEAGDGVEAVESTLRLAPDVVLMDLRMPVLGGAEATRRLKAQAPDVRVIVLTTFEEDEEVFSALRAGAAGFLLKDASSEKLGEAIRLAARGETWLQPSVAAKLVAEFARTAPRPAPIPTASLLEPLSARERDVLRCLAEGMSNKEIGRRVDDLRGDREEPHEPGAGKIAGAGPHPGGAARPGARTALAGSPPKVMVRGIAIGTGGGGALATFLLSEPARPEKDAGSVFRTTLRVNSVWTRMGFQSVLPAFGMPQMKPRRAIAASVLIPTLCVVTGCESTLDRLPFSVREHLQAAAYASLDPKTQDRLRHGVISMGDTEDMVTLALGSPDLILENRGRDLWTYLAYDLNEGTCPIGAGRRIPGHPEPTKHLYMRVIFAAADSGQPSVIAIDRAA